MVTSTEALIDLKSSNDFFIGIDSDGCVFDTMGIKHKKCFVPAFIEHYNLQSVSKYARESWEFVSLYSRTRGTNRFTALVLTFEQLIKRDSVLKENLQIPDLNSIRNWIESETKLGNPSLKKAVEETNNSELARLYNWSFDANESIGRIVRNVPPFSYVRESLEKMSSQADIIVISSANQESLNREWFENDLKQFVRFIAGQETGNKKECFRQASRGKYLPEKTLMVGDAPGDMAAAKANNALFFPIVPGEEEQSWQRFHKEGLDRFFDGTFAGEYAEKLKNAFLIHLPENPSWQAG